MRVEVLAALALFLGAGIGCKEQREPPARAEPVEAGPVVVGQIASLTGDQAAFGVSTHEGVKLAIDEANAAGGVHGRRLELRMRDAGSDAEQAAKLTARMLAEDRPTALIGAPASGSSLAMAKVAEAAKVPMISPSSTSPAVTRVGEFIFRACFIDSFQGFVMATFARRHLRLNRIAVLRDPHSAYSSGLADVFARKFSELGGLIVGTAAYSAGDTDFVATLRRLKALRPEALYLPGYYRDVAAIAKQARALGLDVPLLGGDGWDSERLVELAAEAVDESYFSTHYSPENPAPRVQTFVTRYRDAYRGRTPDALAALAYDATWVVIEAMRRAQSLAGPALRDELARTRDFAGVTGEIRFDRFRNPVKPAVVVQLREGRPRYVATIEP